MKYACIALGLSIILSPLSSFSVAQEASPLEAYEEYTVALQAGDVEAAFEAAQRAYELAQANWADIRPETGLLAANYAYLLSQRQEYREALTVYGVCEAVLLKYMPDTRNDAANCQLQMGYLYLLTKNDKEAERAFLQTLETAEEVPEDNKTLSATAGEASLALARLYYPEKIKIDKMSDNYSEELELMHDYAEQALQLLQQAHGKEHPDVAMAHFFIGLYHEANQASEAAAYAYELSYVVRRKLLGKDNELTRQAFGRMMYNGGAQPGSQTASQTLKYNEEGCGEKQIGEDLVKTCVIRRVPPEYPDKASKQGRFGYVYIYFDIDVKGRPKNMEVYNSWPDDFFDRAALQAVSKWVYAPPVNQDGEPREFTGVLSTFFFELKF